ncbi:hypothetical protein G0U57_004795, partial [Chelydra serpentina]
AFILSVICSPDKLLPPAHSPAGGGSRLLLSLFAWRKMIGCHPQHRFACSVLTPGPLPGLVYKCPRPGQCPMQAALGLALHQSSSPARQSGEARRWGQSPTSASASSAA